MRPSSPGHRKQPPRLVDAFQLMHAPIDQLQPRPGDEIAHGARHDDLAGACRRGNPRADVHRDTCELAGDALALSGVQSGTYVESELAHGVDDGNGATDRAGRPVEAREKSVARGIDLRAAKARELVPYRRIVTLDQVAPCPVAFA